MNITVLTGIKACSITSACCRNFAQSLSEPVMVLEMDRIEDMKASLRYFDL